jgi:hypothetical protein
MIGKDMQFSDDFLAVWRDDIPAGPTKIADAANIYLKLPISAEGAL